MDVRVILAVLIAILAEGSSLDISADSAQKIIHNDQIQILYRLIASECPPSAQIKQQSTASLDLQMLILLYNRLKQKLQDCRNKKLPPAKPLGKSY